MTVLKLLGGALVAAFCCGISAEARRRDAERLALIDGFLRLIAFARSEVDCFLTPQGRILEKCGAEMLSACGWTEAEPPRNLSAVVAGARAGLDHEAYRLLLPFAASFGRGFREEQLKMCDSCLSALGDIRRTLEGELPRRRRAFLSTAICAAVAAALVLL